MTLKIVEGLIIGLLVLISLMIRRQTFTHNIWALVYRLLRFLLTYWAGVLTFRWAMGQGYSLLISGVGSVVAGFLTLFVLGFILRPSKHDKKPRSLPNRLFQRTGNILLILFFWLGVAMIMDLTATVIEQTPYRQQVKSQSWLLGGFIRWHESDSPLLGESRQWLYDQTGLNHLLEQINAIGQIQQMDPPQRSALINEDQNLKALLENPDVLEVLNSPEIQKLIKRAGQGDAQALWQLGKNPGINQLLSDPTLYKRIMAINPSQLIAQQKQTDRVEPAP